MSSEQQIVSDLTQAFPFLQDKFRIARARRIFVNVPPEKFADVFKHIYERAGFTILCTITGLDLGDKLGALYHFAQESGTVLNIQVDVPKDAPILQTVSRTFPAADAYERELVDLFGIQVQGLPPGHRYPLPDGWPTDQHPLRKDWRPATGGSLPVDPKEPK
jgi:membrane-bound hydrogenase subunit beta